MTWEEEREVARRQMLAKVIRNGWTCDVDNCDEPAMQLTVLGDDTVEARCLRHHWYNEDEG